MPDSTGIFSPDKKKAPYEGALLLPATGLRDTPADSDSAEATEILISRPRKAKSLAFRRRTKKSSLVGSFAFAGDRTRTSTLLLRVDFESTASTNFATPA